MDPILPPPSADSSPLSSTLVAGPGDWEIGEVLSTAWGVFKMHWAVLFGSMVIGAFIMYGGSALVGVVFGITHAVPAVSPGASPQALFASTFASMFAPAQIALQLVGFVISTFFTIGWIRIFVTAVRGGSPEISQLFSGFDRLPAALGVSLLSFVAVLAGLIALIIPAIIIGLGLAFASYRAADTERGVVDCISDSWTHMRGSKLRLFGLGFVLALINLAGTVALCVGLLVTVPLSFVVYAVVYTRLFPQPAPAPVIDALPAI